MTYHFRVHEDPDGRWAECLELEGCVTQEGISPDGKTQSLRVAMTEALELYLDDPPDSSRACPLPDARLDEDATLARVSVNPELAFAVALRRTRADRRLTQAAAARELGFPSLWSYQRLEARPNPSLKTIRRILEVFPEFPVELALR